MGGALGGGRGGGAMGGVMGGAPNRGAGLCPGESWNGRRGGSALNVRGETGG